MLHVCNGTHSLIFQLLPHEVREFRAEIALRHGRSLHGFLGVFTYDVMRFGKKRLKQGKL